MQNLVKNQINSNKRVNRMLQDKEIYTIDVVIKGYFILDIVFFDEPTTNCVKGTINPKGMNV